MVVSGGISVYDVRNFMYEEAPPEEAMQNYLNQESLRSVLHIESSPKSPQYVISNETVYQSMSDDQANNPSVK